LPNQKIFKKDDLHKLSRRRKAKAQRLFEVTIDGVNPIY
ncbi:hypothetical protein Tco_0383469, partial [Tanacetum coccineum]